MLPSKLNTQPMQNSIDFFSELSKIMQSTSVSSSSSAPLSLPSTHENICLISKEELHPNHITLTCNHKFNYMPIYKEVLYQKTKSNTMYEVTKLQPYQIKCPYCRTITNKLLPFIPYPSVKRAKNIHSVGSDCLSAKKCSYITKTRNTNNTTTTTMDSNCDKNALYYESENLVLCPSHYKKHIAKNPIGATKVEKVSTKPRCTAILKSGSNIGKPCNSIISIDGSQFCKRHSQSQ
jgi:hypothetical protein